MTSTRSLPGLIVTALLLLAPYFAAAVRSQTTAPPAATFSLTRYPNLTRSVWPGDFNSDGRTDLIAYEGGGTTPRGLVLLIGHGDGTFANPVAIASGSGFHPVGVADMNGDGRADLLVSDADVIYVLLSHGDGTFGPLPEPGVGVLSDGDFVLAGDFNGDGKRDLVVNGEYEQHYEPSVAFYAGNGDGTFAPPAEYPGNPQHGIVGDFNRDGKTDVAYVEASGDVHLLLNQGGMLFTASDLPAGNGDRGEITTGDLNRDGALDLVVTAWTDSSASDYPGHITVLLGHGDGTFQTGVEYDSGVRNEYAVVVGDFTRDGLLDVATGNRSFVYNDDFGYQLWDSVSIFKGDGAGHLGGVTTFVLGKADQPGYRNEIHTLKTSDLNGDHQTDLIASPGAILLNLPPAANRPPTVNAGPDGTYTTEDPYFLRASANDPDNHWLSYAWRDASGRLIGTTPWVAPVGFNWGNAAGTYVYTVTVGDGHGGVASDSVTITVKNPPRNDAPLVVVNAPVAGDVLTVGVPFTIRWMASDADGLRRIDVSFASDSVHFQPIPECTNLPGTASECRWNSPGPLTERGAIVVYATDTTGLSGGNSAGRFAIRPADGSGGLPPDWGITDVGAVATPGSANFNNGTFTVRGSGADIWGTADEFAGTFTVVDGDFVATARVASVQNVNQWTKAGLMVRDQELADSVHASLFATPTTAKGLAFQRRPAHGAQSVHTAGPAITAPVWIRLARTNSVISAYYRRTEADSWTLIGTQVLTGLRSSALVGLVVGSHVDGTLATATFDHVTIDTSPAFASRDIGAVGRPGTTVNTGSGIRLEGSGADIWGTADEFRYFYQPWSLDGSITVRLRSVENTDAWAKAGVMFRDTLDANARQVMLIVSAGKGIAMQYRSATGGSSAQVRAVAGTAPQWLRLTRVSNTFTASASADGSHWTTIGSIDVPMGSAIYAGLAVTSHNDTTLATAEFEMPFVRK